jgi:hypothetical protein
MYNDDAVLIQPMPEKIQTRFDTAVPVDIEMD